MSAAPDRAHADAVRSPLGVALAVALAATVCLLPLIPAVRVVLGVGPRDVAIAMGAIAALMIAGAIVYARAAPGSRAFAIFDRAETALIQVAVLWLVVASGRGDSFFWLLWIPHLVILGTNAHVRFNVATVIAAPLAVAAAFLAGGRAEAAALAVAIGGLGSFLFWFSLASHRKLVAVDAERQRLAAELAEARVHQERARIARDIHDGLGADLAALDWRLRSLRDDASSPLRAEVDELVRRVGHGTDELRAIVWALRSPARRWTELVAYLRQRIAELCGDAIAYEIVDGGDGGIAARPGELAIDYLRAVLELVHNAARHAGATRIAVELRSSAELLEAVVEDDGRGLPAGALARDEGGLANLRVRAARAGGRLVASTPPRGGARFAIALRGAPS